MSSLETVWKTWSTSLHEICWFVWCYPGCCAVIAAADVVDSWGGMCDLQCWILEGGGEMAILSFFIIQSLLVMCPLYEDSEEGNPTNRNITTSFCLYILINFLIWFIYFSSWIHFMYKLSVMFERSFKTISLKASSFCVQRNGRW